MSHLAFKSYDYPIKPFYLLRQCSRFLEPINKSDTISLDERHCSFNVENKKPITHATVHCTMQCHHNL